ncbi:acid protease [Coprinellus micaceus]|uniref:Acid protease n=1 Tax=Coprinellus micaceus TaxID=71717 RepID=A0A4Y7TIK1_COPMI|nr:acid protease [Coprinellus micaceus]
MSRFRPLTLPIHTVSSSGPLLQPRDVVGANGQQGAGLSAVGMSSDRQSHYTVVKVGEIYFRVALDTASSDLWIVSTACGTATCTKVPRYPLAYQGPTFVSVNDNATTFAAGYADGSTASGFVAKETIQVANLTIPEQHFGLVTNSNLTLTDQVSGIFGLGFPRLSSISKATNSTPFFTTLAYKGLLDYPLFALSLAKNGTGSLTLGAIDSSVVGNNTSQISWNRVAAFPPFVIEVNVTSPTYLQWAIPLASFSVNNTSLDPISTYPTVRGGQSLALIDAGSSGISGPVQDVSRIFSQIEGARLVNSDAGQWVIPCDTTVPITVNYTLLPEDYLIGPASGNPNLCLSWPRASSPNSDGIDWQFGAPFLRTVYSVFSFGINTKEPPIIGFYHLRNATELANLTTSQTPEYISSYLASISATYPTTLPNVILPTPSYTTPAYTLNTSVSAPSGGRAHFGAGDEHVHASVWNPDPAGDRECVGSANRET